MAIQFTEPEQDPLAESAPPVAIDEILLLHHSHLDVGYTHSQPMLWQLQNEFVSEAVDWLERTHDLPADSRPKWTCEVTEPLRRWLAQASPPQVGRFRRLHEEGRIGIAALRWHISASVDRAGLQRLVDGKHELEQLLGTKIRVACQHDVNGVPWPLADVLLDAGVDLFVMAVNSHLGRAVQPRPGMFLWEAPSGRTLRVFNGHHYTMFDQLLHAWDDSVESMAEGWDSLAARLVDIGYRLPFVYLTTTCSPVLWDNAPPNPFLSSLIERWNEAARGPSVRYATFDDLRDRAFAVPDGELPTLRGDWTDYWSFGYGSMPIATRLNRKAKRLADAAAALGGSESDDVLRTALERADLYDEHTFSYWDTAAGHPQAQTIEVLKQGLAHEGYELASFALMDRLERIAQNAVADRGVKGVVLCNPGAYPATVRPHLPESWFEPQSAVERTYRASRMAYENRSWDVAPERPRYFGPIELAPRSWQIIPLEDLTAPPARSGLSHRVEAEAIERREMNRASTATHVRRIGRIESSFYSLSYESHSGRVLSLVDRVRERELLAPRSGLDFFSFVRERADGLGDPGRYAFYQRDLEHEKVDVSCWQPWSPVRERATRLLHFEVIEERDQITFERVLAAPGVHHLLQRISLVDGDPVIRLDVELELEPEPAPQGIYFAFPLALQSGWEAVFDTAGQFVRVDDDQLPGAARNWVTVDSYAGVADGSSAVALFCPDAPLVQFGDFHFGPPLDYLPRREDPLLLAWAVNNYWDTNFPRVQPGRLRLQYGLMALGSLDAETLRAHANTLRQPTLIWPVTSNGRGAGSGSLP